MDLCELLKVQNWHKFKETIYIYIQLNMFIYLCILNILRLFKKRVLQDS